MLTNVVIPSLGLTMEEGIIVEWLRKEGDRVRKEEPIVLIETDKATLEVHAPTDGILGGICADPGEGVPVGNTIAKIYSEEEYNSLSLNNTGQKGETFKQVKEVAITVSPTKSTSQVTVPSSVEAKILQSIPHISKSNRIIASPAARKRARELEVDLKDVRGTGPIGRILESNVLAYHAKIITSKTPTTLEHFRADIQSGMRKTIAKRMVASRQTTAPVTIFMEVHMDEAVNMRRQVNQDLQQNKGYKLTYDAMFTKATAIALKSHPALMAQWDDNGLKIPKNVHIGFAVALTDGLIVPVIRHADSKSLFSIASEVERLSKAAKENRLFPDDLGEGVITISNLGMYPVGGFTPVINLPESAILGIGAIQQKAIVENAQLKIGHVVQLSLTFDHRTVDGAPAAAFLTKIKAILEQPYQLFIED